MKNYALEFYRQMFVSLKRGNRNGVVSNAKPVFLLSLIECVPFLRENLISVDNLTLKDFYNTNIQHFAPECKAPLAMPYFHLNTCPFYSIIWKDESKQIMQAHSPSAKQLVQSIDGAKLDNELWVLLQEEENRQYLRQCLIDYYFTDN